MKKGNALGAVVRPVPEGAVCNAQGAYVIGTWGKCKYYLRDDGKPASAHNHMQCDCPSCAKVTRKIFKCIMTQQWVFEDEIIKTQEIGGGGH